MLKDISQYGILIILAVTVAVVTVTLVINYLERGFNMDVGASTPTNQVAWRQVAEQKYQKLVENLQVEEQRQRVEQLNTTLYIAKNNKVQLEKARTDNCY
jgi:hypothetical protein